MIQLKYPKFWSSINWISSLLIPFSYVYRGLGWLRGKLTKKIILPGKVICIGNITVGGAGKTQVAIWLAKMLKLQNSSFAIVTKGYKSNISQAVLVEGYHKAVEVGDESVILKNFGPVIATKKIIHALKIIRQLSPQILIFDDGMQNPSIKKDFNILVFDSLSAIGNRRIFPAGPLREDLDAGLKKADLILMIGNQECSDFSLLNSIYFTGKPYFRARIKLITNLDSDIQYIAFAGIGNPEKFYSLLEENNCKIKNRISFADHHYYLESDLKKLINLANSQNCLLITTEKDYTKLNDYYKNLIICAKVVLELEDEQEVINLINEKLL